MLMKDLGNLGLLVCNRPINFRDHQWNWRTALTPNSGILTTRAVGLNLIEAQKCAPFSGAVTWNSSVCAPAWNPRSPERGAGTALLQPQLHPRAAWESRDGSTAGMENTAQPKARPGHAAAAERVQKNQPRVCPWLSSSVYNQKDPCASFSNNNKRATWEQFLLPLEQFINNSFFPFSLCFFFFSPCFF